MGEFSIFVRQELPRSLSPPASRASPSRRRARFPPYHGLSLLMMLHARLVNASAPRATWLLRPSTRVTAINSSTNSFRLGALRLQATASRRGFSSSSNKSSSSSGNTSENIFARAWAKYLALLESRPLATKIATGGAIAGIGDINCQIFLEPGHPFSVKRAATFTFIGGVFISPILHVWYAFLSRALPGTSTLVRHAAAPILRYRYGC